MKMYEYEIGEITEEGDKTSVTGMIREVKNDLEQRNLPAHYNIAGINTMDFIIATCEHNKTNQRETFYLANTLKYLIRYKNKNGLEDLKKAKDYLNRLIEYTTI